MDIVKLKPATKDYLWGGTRLLKAGKEAPTPILAECWELSFHPDGPCLIASGPDEGKTLSSVCRKDDVGSYVADFPFFPVLIKLIDAAKNLSVQVHPSDEYALKNEGSFGKTEMWHILHAEPGCGLYVGFKEDVSKEEVKEALDEGKILSLLNFFPVKPGESYFIPSGTIHAIGKGVTLIEIQQNSNLTYRLYDYDRVGPDGKKRPLHIEKAMKVIDCHKYERKQFPGDLIGKCRYFASYRLNEKQPNVAATPSSFSSITFLSGSGSFAGIPFRALDTFFIPAGKEGAIVSDSPYDYVLTRVEP